MSYFKQLIQEWVESTPSSEAPQLIRADEQYSAATVGANFLGKNTSIQGATGISIYLDPRNMPTAVASILNRTRKKANFHPASDSQEVVAQNYVRYIKEIDSVPFLFLRSNEQTTQKSYDKNYDKLIDGIVSLYDGVSAKDKDAIKNSIANMGKAVFGKESKEEWKNLFSQATIDFTDLYNPVLYIYYTTLYMKYEKKKSEVTIQEFTVNKAEYTILTQLIQANAGLLAGLDTTSVIDWLTDSTTPAQPGAKLCFEVTPVKED